MRSSRLLPLAVLALLSACSDADTSSSTSVGETATSTGENPNTGEPTSTTSTTDEDPATTTTGPATGASTGPTTGPADTTGDPGADSSGDVGSTDDTGATGDAQELPPIESVEVLEAWLAAGSYKTWAVESGVHPSTGPHGGNVRTFVNDVALASLAAQNAEHPQDSATVKELYGDSVDTIIGYAVSLKTTPESQGGATWYWYERINATTYGGDLGVGLCTGCHGGGADFILTPYPLQ